MKLPLFAVAIAAAAIPGTSGAKLPPLRDPVFLNIGFVCQWQERCMDKQQRAQKRALAYVRKYDPPDWKVQLCNRRSVQRRSGRVDWIGYNNCIRNPKVVRSEAASRRAR
jgi:hypothetical protein